MKLILHSISIYKPPRPLDEIESDITKVTSEIQKLLKG